MEKENSKEFRINWVTIALILILICAFSVRFYFFYQYKDQPVWWDESEHLVMAKHIAFGLPDTGWNSTREILLSLIFAIALKIYNSEIFLRFLQIVFSFLVVLFTYLVGKEIFNKNVGLVAALGMAVFAEFLFWSMRFGLEAIGILLSLLFIFFFWKGYIKKEKPYFIYISAVFAALSIVASAKEGLVIFSIFLFLFFKERFTLLRQKQIWAFIILVIIVLAPFMLYYYNVTGHPLPRLMTQTESVQARLSEGGWSWQNFFVYSRYFDNYLLLPFFAVFLIGLIYTLITLILGFDLVLKGKEVESSGYLLLLFWIALPLTSFSYFMGQSPGAYFDPRMILESFPAVFILLGIGSERIYSWLKAYKKEVAIGIVLILLLIGAFLQFKVASATISARSTSFIQVKEAALWMKANSNEGDWIITASAPQTTYYAERQTIGPPENETEFIPLIKEKKPKFMVISIFEYQPPWYFEWPQKYSNNVKLVQAYTIQQNGQDQAVLLIYEFLVDSQNAS